MTESDDRIDVSARLDEIARLREDSATWSRDELRKRVRTLARVTTDATVSGDERALAELHGLAIASGPRTRGDADSEFRRGVFEAFEAVAAEALRETEAREVLATVAAGSLPHRMLALIEGHEALPSSEVGRQLGQPKASTVSRAGRTLLDRGLVEKVGTKPTTWTITNRGQRVLDAVGRVMPAATPDEAQLTSELLVKSILESFERMIAPMRRYTVDVGTTPVPGSFEPTIPLASGPSAMPYPFDPMEFVELHEDLQRLFEPASASGIRWQIHADPKGRTLRD